MKIYRFSMVIEKDEDGSLACPFNKLELDLSACTRESNCHHDRP
mgnify:CR=1 FL=1|jgi:hypothetical protein